MKDYLFCQRFHLAINSNIEVKIMNSKKYHVCCLTGDFFAIPDNKYTWQLHTTLQPKFNKKKGI